LQRTHNVQRRRSTEPWRVHAAFPAGAYRKVTPLSSPAPLFPIDTVAEDVLTCFCHTPHGDCPIDIQHSPAVRAPAASTKRPVHYRRRLSRRRGQGPRLAFVRLGVVKTLPCMQIADNGYMVPLSPPIRGYQDTPCRCHELWEERHIGRGYVGTLNEGTSVSATPPWKDVPRRDRRIKASRYRGIV